MSINHSIQYRQFKGSALKDSHKTVELQDTNKPACQSDDKQVRPDTSMRPVWIILFAAILILICTKSKADEHPVAFAAAAAGSTETGSSLVSQATLTIELNGEVHVIQPTLKPAPVQLVPVDLSSVSSSSVQQASWIPVGNRRPTHAHLAADLANFDADADPDGWHAEVVLFGRDDHPVAVRGQANFELTPRVPTGDFHHYVDDTARSISWSENLKFDADAVARFKLPLRSPLRTSWGWSSAIYPKTGLRPAAFGRRSSIRGIGADRSAHPRLLGATVARDIRSSLGKPEFGELRVRVSVPGEGVFDAVTVVPIRPAVLVDTHWPYR